MKNYSRHIILFAWMQVILLLFPTVVKLIHQHTPDSIQTVCHNHKASVCNATHTASCPICDFEFVQFVQPPALYLSETPTVFSELFCFSFSFETVSSIALPSLRAPPVC